MESSEGKALASTVATQMEAGKRPDLLDLWCQFRDLSLNELQHLYAVSILSFVLSWCFPCLLFFSVSAISVIDIVHHQIVCIKVLNLVYSSLFGQLAFSQNYSVIKANLLGHIRIAEIDFGIPPLIIEVLQ